MTDRRIMAIPDPRTLSRPEIFALNWLSRRGGAPYESCRGPGIDRLISIGLIEKTYPTAQGRYLAEHVAVTERGREALRQVCERVDGR